MRTAQANSRFAPRAVDEVLERSADFQSDVSPIFNRQMTDKVSSRDMAKRCALPILSRLEICATASAQTCSEFTLKANRLFTVVGVVAGLFHEPPVHGISLAMDLVKRHQ